MNMIDQIQERIWNRHKLLDYLVIVKWEGATKEEIVKDIGPDAPRALEDLVALGIVKRKGERFFVPKRVAQRWGKIAGWEGHD
jgi:hypothetical protein